MKEKEEERLRAQDSQQKVAERLKAWEEQKAREAVFKDAEKEEEEKRKAAAAVLFKNLRF